MANESFIRWQANTIAQVGNCLNVVLALGTATFGYYLDSAIEKKFGILGFERYLLGIGLIVVGLSIACGVVAHFTRAIDFRKTSKIASLRDDEQEAKLVEELRSSTRQVGKFTWALVWSQLGFFCIGILIMVIFTSISTFQNN